MAIGGQQTALSLWQLGITSDGPNCSLLDNR